MRRISHETRSSQPLILFHDVEQVEQTIGGFDNFASLGFDLIWRKLSLRIGNG